MGVTMNSPEIVLCINQSWGCQLNKTYEVLDHWKCGCDPRDKGLIRLKDEQSISIRNPEGVLCLRCEIPAPLFVKGWFPGGFFVPITGTPIPGLEIETYEPSKSKEKIH